MGTPTELEPGLGTTVRHGIAASSPQPSQFAIRHEYVLNSIKRDTSLFLFVKPGAEGLMPILFAASEKWHQTEKESRLIGSSLRTLLMKALLIELGNRLVTTSQSEETMQVAKDTGWVAENGEWKTLCWDPTSEQLRKFRARQRHLPRSW